jgi:tetratricopeptide (TPR) repeat protein
VRGELRPEDGLSVGRAALRIRPDIAIHAFGVAAQASGPAAATAAFDLGELLEQRGEKDVFAAYLRAIDAACADEPMSALVRGLRQQEQGEVEDAGRAYRRAIDSNDVNATPMAMFLLGCCTRSRATWKCPSRIRSRDRTRPRRRNPNGVGQRRGAVGAAG